MRPRASSVLAVYMEPAPYVVRLVESLRKAWNGLVDVVYIGEALSQPWKAAADSVLPNGTWRAVAEIRRRLSSGRYRLVHLAGWGHPVLLATLMLARAKKLPVVVESDTPRSMAGSRVKQVVKRMAYPMLFALPSRFLPGGAPQAEYLRHYGVPDERITVAMMSVDIAEMAAGAARMRQHKARALERLGISDACVRFLYVGRLEPHKGIGDLISAFQMIWRPGRDVALLIAGDGSMRDAVEQSTERCSGIRYLDRVEGDRLFEAYAIADVLVLPSLFEPWGLVVNEGMAAGLPVIVTDRVGCAQDLVTPHATGMVVPAGSPDALAAAMAALAADAGLTARMGSAAKNAIAPWTIENWAAHTIEAWRLALP